MRFRLSTRRLSFFLEIHQLESQRTTPLSNVGRQLFKKSVALGFLNYCQHPKGWLVTGSPHSTPLSNVGRQLFKKSVALGFLNYCQHPKGWLVTGSPHSMPHQQFLHVHWLIPRDDVDVRGPPYMVLVTSIVTWQYWNSGSTFCQAKGTAVCNRE